MKLNEKRELAERVYQLSLRIDSYCADELRTELEDIAHSIGKLEILDGEPSEEMGEAGAEYFYGIPRAEAIKLARRTFKAMIAAVENSDEP